jgi:hypothetical protein
MRREALSHRKVPATPLPLHRISGFGRLVTKLIWLRRKPWGRDAAARFHCGNFESLMPNLTLDHTNWVRIIDGFSSNVAFPFCDAFALLKMLAGVIHSATGRRAKVGTARLLLAIVMARQGEAVDEANPSHLA